MKSKLSKTEAEKEIKKFFSDIKNKTPQEIKKMKKLAMKHNIKLKEKRKLFCKKCLIVYTGKEKVRIIKDKKIITCLGCGYISRWEL